MMSCISNGLLATEASGCHLKLFPVGRELAGWGSCFPDFPDFTMPSRMYLVSKWDVSHLLKVKKFGQV
jgi:hypothetical protein